MLIDIMTNSPQREVGGPIALKGLTFQVFWAINRIVQLHETEDDYALLIEQWDDVVSLDSSTNPKEMTFYQVKDYAKISVADLCRQDKNSKGTLTPSTLGKMCRHYDEFKNHAAACYLVSSAPVYYPDTKIRNQDPTVLTALTPAPLCTVILDKLTKETGHKEENLKNRIGFIITTLPSQSTKDATVGKFAHFIREKYNKQLDYLAFIETLQSDIIGKACTLLPHFQDYDELLKYKGFTAPKIEKFIQSAINDTSIDKIIGIVSKNFSQEGKGFVQIRKSKEAIEEYQKEKMKYHNEPLSELQIDIEKTFDTITEDLNFSQAVDFTEESIEKNIHKSYHTTCDKKVRRGAILYEAALCYT